MSVVVTVAAMGAVSLAPTVLSGIASAAAAAMGLRALDAGAVQAEGNALHDIRAENASTQAAALNQVEVTLATEAALEELVAERCSLHFGDDEMTLTVHRDIRGKLTVHAHAEHVSKSELTARAEKLLGLIVQQVAYRDVVQKMKNHGLLVEQEARDEDGVVRVRIRRPR